MEEATDSTDNGPAEEEPSRVASALIGALETFRSNQEDLLYTADYILRQESELDDRKERAKSHIDREFPHVDASVLDMGWKVLSVELSEVARSSNLGSDGESSSSPRDTPEHKEALTAFVEALPDDCWSEYVSAVAEALKHSRATPQSSKLLSSLLTSLIADFEVLVGNLLRTAITEYPAIINGSGRSYTWAEISGYEDLAAFRLSQIDKTIDTLLFGSFDDWLEFFEKKLHISIPEIVRSPSTVEIFQRRHMIVHNGGIASQQYVSSCKSSPYKGELDDELRVDIDYLRHASDRILSIGMYLVFAVAQKFAKEPASVKMVEGYVSGVIVYHLLQHERFQAVNQISSVIAPDSLQNAGPSYRYRVNSWLAQKRLGKLAVCRLEIEGWDTTVLEPLFKLAKHALLDELDAGMKLVQSLRASDELPLRHWLTWPLLAELREYDKKYPSNTGAGAA